jgi:hypothetical protein
LRDLAAKELAPGSAYAVTAALQAELRGEDQEGWVYSAFLSAADASLARLGPSAGNGGLARVVISADVPAAMLTAPRGPNAHPAEVLLVAQVPWQTVAAIHADPPEGTAEIARAIAGDVTAADRLEDEDLAWYDPSERSALVARIGPSDHWT